MGGESKVGESVVVDLVTAWLMEAGRAGSKARGWKIFMRCDRWMGRGLWKGVAMETGGVMWCALGVGQWDFDEDRV